MLLYSENSGTFPNIGVKMNKSFEQTKKPSKRFIYGVFSFFARL